MSVKVSLNSGIALPQDLSKGNESFRSKRVFIDNNLVMSPINGSTSTKKASILDSLKPVSIDINENSSFQK